MTTDDAIQALDAARLHSDRYEQLTYLADSYARVVCSCLIAGDDDGAHRALDEYQRLNAELDAERKLT